MYVITSVKYQIRIWSAHFQRIQIHNFWLWNDTEVRMEHFPVGIGIFLERVFNLGSLDLVAFSHLQRSIRWNKFSVDHWENLKAKWNWCLDDFSCLPNSNQLSTVSGLIWTQTGLLIKSHQLYVTLGFNNLLGISPVSVVYVSEPIVALSVNILHRLLWLHPNKTITLWLRGFKFLGH